MTSPQVAHALALIAAAQARIEGMKVANAINENGYVVPVDKIINDTTISWNGVEFTDVELICPECGGIVIQRSHEGDMLAPEATWYACTSCYFQTELE